MISCITRIPITYNKEITDSFTLSNFKLLRALKIRYNFKIINSENIKKYL